MPWRPVGHEPQTPLPPPDDPVGPPPPDPQPLPIWEPVGDVSGPPGPAGPQGAPGPIGSEPDMLDLTLLFENGLH